MSISNLRIPALVTATLAASLTLAACSSSGGGTSVASSSATSPAAPSASSPGSVAAPSTSQGGPPPATAGTVTATESEFSIALSTKTLKPGAYTFRVKNTGSVTHALTVNGPGVQDKSTGDISPGSSATVTVTLKTGSYEVYCPVGNHKMEGMDETVKVA